MNINMNTNTNPTSAAQQPKAEERRKLWGLFCGIIGDMQIFAVYNCKLSKVLPMDTIHLA